MLREVLDTLWNSRSEEVDKRFHDHLATIEEVRQHIMEDHRAIVAAIVQRDGEAARRAMTAHLDYVSAAMLNTWE